MRRTAICFGQAAAAVASFAPAAVWAASPTPAVSTPLAELPLDDAETGPQAPPPEVVREEQQPAMAPRLEIYTTVTTDFGYNFMTIDPDWFDVMRPSKLPAFANEFGADGRIFASVRQTRFGVRGEIPTAWGELKTTFEWELFGVGEDAGQTTLRLRHAYAQLGHFGVGQWWSPFMDIDVFPNSIEYWGPNGMVFFRNVQVRWMPIMKENTFLTFALERPGASADLDQLEVPALTDVSGRFPAPDFSAEFRYGGGWGYVEEAAIVRYIAWDDLGTDQFNLAGHALGWGFNTSSNVKLSGKNVLKLQVVYGRAIQNYMNDGGADIGVQNNPGDPLRPFVGDPLPIVGALAFVDLYWNALLSSSFGYSHVHVWNTDAQPGVALASGQYALGNLLFHPTEDILMGAELQWGRRVGFDGFTSNDVKLQFSFKYGFSQTIGGRP
jgi:hypothetical protein